MKVNKKTSILAIVAIILSGCVTDPYTEEAAVKRLVAEEGQLAQNVDADFEGEAYDQDGKKVVCRKIKVTGSRIGQYTVCRTEAEWATTQDDAARNHQRVIDAASAAGTRG